MPKHPLETVRNENMRLEKQSGTNTDEPGLSGTDQNVRKQDYTSGAIFSCVEELETPQEAEWQFESKSCNTWSLHCFGLRFAPIMPA